MTNPTTSEQLEDVYDEIVDLLIALVTPVATITEVHRGYPRFAVTSFAVPSAYIYYTNSDPAPQQDVYGQERIAHNFALAVFLNNEKQLLDLIGRYEDSNLCNSNILSGTYRVDFRSARRVQGRELPLSADYGVSISIGVIL